MNKFVRVPKNTNKNVDRSRKSYEMQNDGPNTGPTPYELPHQIKEQSELKKTIENKKITMNNSSNKEEKDSTISEMI